jgi:acetyl esterase/lipase
VDGARVDARIDGDRVAVWAFSGGGPLLTPWLARSPAWLRCLAATYPVLDSRPDAVLPAGFRPIDTLGAGSPLPFVLTRVGLESAPIAAGVVRFLTAAEQSRLRVTIVDVPNGHHGFDTTDPGQESTGAVQSALGLVAAAVQA